MSDRQSAPSRDLRIAPLLTAVVYASLLATGWAFTSLVLDVDVISEPDAGPFIGPLMAVIATVTVWFALWGLRNRRAVGATIAAASATVFCLMLAGGALAYAIGLGDAAVFVLFVGKYAVSLFVIVPAVLAGLTVLTYWLVGARSLVEKPFDPPRGTD